MRGRLGIGTEGVSGCRLRHRRSVARSQENLSYLGSNGIVRGGSEGNERLTATAGAALFLLLAAEGVTILSIRPLLSAHVFIGMLLVPPVALKLATTGWRFARYYRGSPEYRRKGPPLLPLRLLAPVVVVSTVALFATGITLLVVGPGAGFVLLLHKASFVVWVAATGIHVLFYVARVPRLASADWRPWAIVASALVAGAILAVVTVQYAESWTRA
jgi:hypothetical protein